MNALQPTFRRETGISLLVVMVMLLLCSLLALGAARMGWLNEALVGNISDEQRAFLAAEALMRDAQRDIQNPGNRSLGGAAYFPLDAGDLTRLQNADKTASPCTLGLCFPQNLSDLNGSGDTNWWQQGAQKTASMRLGGALYGQITGDTTPTGNSLLTPTGNRLAHYWIEVFPYATSGDTLAGRTPPNDRPFIYRVTVVVDGLKAGTRVVLQSIMSP
jgi:type IV pilus assembly protein PilX